MEAKKLTKEEQLARLLMSKTRTEGTCILWTGSHNGRGYGQVFIEGKRYYTHRLAYELSNGEIPVGKVIDHLCRRTPCINPEHLRAVTQRENVLSGDTIPAAHVERTHCGNGHEFTPENTIMKKDDSNRYRACRICRDVRAEEYYYRKQQDILKQKREKYKEDNHVD